MKGSGVSRGGQFSKNFPRKKPAILQLQAFFFYFSYMVRLAGIEPTTPWFVAKYSIQLSYSREALDSSTGLTPKSKPVSPSRPRASSVLATGHAPPPPGLRHAPIEELAQKRAHIDETLAELKVINASCRQQAKLRSKPIN